jgi:hypothetical protein
MIGYCYHFSILTMPTSAYSILLTAVFFAATVTGTTSYAQDSQLTKAAEAGDAKAEFDLGRAYEDGKGMPQDDAMAAEWFRKSAEQGNADAQNSLGAMYAQGRGVERDRTEAMRWYRKAASNGSPDAMYHIAIAYYNGEGEETNLDLAFTWFLAAQKKGNTQADDALKQISAQLADHIERSKFDLAQLLESGNEIPRDLPAAVALYQESGGQKNSIFASSAEVKLCQLYANEKSVQDYTQAQQWCAKAGKNGSGAAYLVMGQMAEQGAGGQSKDIRKAIDWYRRAAMAMLPAAYLELGRLRAESGSHADQRKAYFWFCVAFRQRVAAAEPKLKEAASHLTDKEIEDELKQIVLWPKSFTFRQQAAAAH